MRFEFLVSITNVRAVPRTHAIHPLRRAPDGVHLRKAYITMGLEPMTVAFVTDKEQGRTEEGKFSRINNSNAVVSYAKFPRVLVTTLYEPQLSTRPRLYFLQARGGRCRPTSP